MNHPPNPAELLQKVAELEAELEQIKGLLTDNISDIIWRLDTSYRITYVTPSVKKVLGYLPEEVLGKVVFTLFRPASIEKVKQAAVQRLVDEKKGVQTDMISHEYELIRKDGSFVWTDGRTTPIRDESGQISGFVGVTRDISDRKRFEAALKKSEERLALFSKVTVEGLVFHEQGQIIDLNEAAATMIGFSDRAELIGRSVLEFLTSESLPLVLQVLKTTEGQKYEAKLCHKNGSTFPVEIISQVVDYQGRPTRVASFHDLTDLKRSEQALIKAKKEAEAATTAKSQFLANMSHEIRTPMNSILGFLELLMDLEPSEKQREYVGYAQSAAYALLELIDQILDLSKIEARRLELNKHRFNLTDLLKNIKAIHLPMAQKKGLSLTLSIPSPLPEDLLGDSARLTQVLHNLLGNAVKFTEKGEISVHANLLDQNTTSTRVYFQITDTGIGISQDHVQNLFVPFTQADATTTRKYGGTGLGLSIARELVALMGGEISVGSCPGQGSTFSFTICFDRSAGQTIDSAEAPKDWPALPDSAKVYPPAAGKKTENQPVSAGPKRILLVEDNDINQKLFCHLLETLGLSAELALNGREALTLLEKKEYDIIFLDCQMPIMDGYECAAEIRKREGGQRHTPIIALTASAMFGDREKCLAAGMDDHIAKPILKKVLMKFIERYLQVS